MIIYKTTTVFNVNAQTIVNPVNCKGIMSAGLALEFALRFPQMYDDYLYQCRNNWVQVGSPYIYKEANDLIILNFPTKNDWRKSSKLEWIESGLIKFANSYQAWGITSVAFPKLGCGLGELDWNLVKPLMEKYLNNLDIDVYVCLDQEMMASGIEAKMLALLNNKENTFWIKNADIKPATVEIILQSLPLYRLRKLHGILKVDRPAYPRIFRCLYLAVKQKANTDVLNGVIKVEI